MGKGKEIERERMYSSATNILTSVQRSTYYALNILTVKWH